MKSPDPLVEQQMKEQGSIGDRGLFGWSETRPALLQMTVFEWVNMFQGEVYNWTEKYPVYLVCGDSLLCSITGKESKWNRNVL